MIVGARSLNVLLGLEGEALDASTTYLRIVAIAHLPHAVTAVAARDTDLLRIDREEFFELLADHSAVTRELFQALFKRVRSILSAGIESPTDSATPAS